MGTFAGVLCALGAAWAGPATPVLPVTDVAAALSIDASRSAVVETELSAIVNRPWSWMAQPVHFEMVLEGADVPFQPWLSSFGPRDWAALSAWSDDADLWNAKVHATPFARLFIDRGAADLGALLHAHRYERFSCWGVVREVHLGQPWIEVVRAEPLLDDVPSGAVLHASRAVDLWGQGQRQLAVSELERAQLAPLPAAHASRLSGLEAQWRLDLERQPFLPGLRHGRPAESTVYRLDLTKATAPSRFAPSRREHD
jgi:hypothetical protein